MKKFFIHLLAVFIRDKNRRKIFRNRHISRVHLATNEDLHNITDEICRKMSLIKEDNIWTLPNGIKLYCPLYPWDLIQGSIVNTHNFFEYDTLVKLRKFIPPKAVILDIGGNIGNHSVFWASEGASKIHCFEPVKETYRMLCKNIEINGLAEIIIPHNVGLGGENSSGEIARSCSTNIGETLIQTSIGYNSYSLQIERLDDMDLGLDRIDFVKIDVENFELQTLAGMRKTLEKYRPAVFIESYESGGEYYIPKGFVSNAPKVKEFFKCLGYSAPLRFEPYDWLFVFSADMVI
jgi:FkbM family methyltransferase